MVTERLTYFLESKCLFSSYQNGFSRGKNAMDALLCLQSEIRKAQTNMFNRLDLRGEGGNFWMQNKPSPQNLQWCI